MKSAQMEPLIRKRQRRDHFFGWWTQFSIVLSSCYKGPFKAWFELAVRTTLLRVRLLIRQNAMYFYWQYESGLIVTWKLYAEPLLQNAVADPGIQEV